MCSEMNVSLLGSLPIDPNLARATEDGVDFVSTYPQSVAVQPFIQFVNKLLDTTPQLAAAKLLIKPTAAATATATATTTATDTTASATH